MTFFITAAALLLFALALAHFIKTRSYASVFFLV
jgi:hypothetical protein